MKLLLIYFKLITKLDLIKKKNNSKFLSNNNTCYIMYAFCI